ncbi:MAG: tRNA lysidine(34) synthetase TilS [Sphingobacterium sp.]
MVILDRLTQFMQQYNLLQTGQRVLLAVSGGRDSMLMARLFYELGQNCIIAHCNFNLRAEESNKDEQLVRGMAKTWGMPFFVEHFDTMKYAQQEKISIQMAARDLRYAWFETLRRQEGCDKIAIAQHGNDHLETVLLNLIRGTGIRGLLGIHVKRDRVIRPLLFLSAEQVNTEVQRLEVPFRDDQSNFSTKYARNKIRHDIVPKFKEIQPDFENIMHQNVHRFEESFAFIKRTIDRIRDQLFRSRDGDIMISKDELRPYLSDGFLMYELFRPYGFNRTSTDDLVVTFDQQVGALFTSSYYELLLDREAIFLRNLIEEIPTPSRIDLPTSSVSWGNRMLRVLEGTAEELYDEHPHREDVDADKLVFPLTLRIWQQGDRFVPLGMQGQKKISDFFIQRKVDRFQKERTPLLVNGNGEVIWVIGMRLDNRYKVTENTKKVLTFVFK